MDVGTCIKKLIDIKDSTQPVFRSWNAAIKATGWVNLIPLFSISRVGEVLENSL